MVGSPASPHLRPADTEAEDAAGPAQAVGRTGDLLVPGRSRWTVTRSALPVGSGLDGLWLTAAPKVGQVPGWRPRPPARTRPAVKP
ncbi:hypothetical protein GCM10010521_17890 [Streptomyces rameus]|uniref:Uncharacterized protein n=1 Tax=Streptomyces rameus TaxID=68261 RepID=A0ABP6N0E4_9ACTN